MIIRQVYKTSELVSDSINDGENDIDDIVAKNISNTVVQVIPDGLMGLKPIHAFPRRGACLHILQKNTGVTAVPLLLPFLCTPM